LAFHVPLSVFAGGIGAIIDTEDSLLIALAVSLSGLLVYTVLKLVSGRAWQSLMGTSALLIGFWHWSASETSGTILRLVWVALIVAAAARFADARRFRVAVLAVATTLAVTPLLQIVIKASGPAPEIASEFDAFPGEPEVLPDIYFLLLDAYGNSNVLSNIYGFDNEPFLTDLERRGFDVSRSATADYTYTHASIPSMLNMEYLTGTDLSENAQSLDRLISAVAGDNRVVTWLKDLGYTYIHGETFDGTNDCGPNVDICLPSPSWDHTVEYLLGRTPVWPLLFPVHGSPATAFNAVRIEQMSQWEEWDATSDEPVFVFLHLLLPHPPYFLDADCATRVLEELGGHSSDRGLSADVIAARRAGYIQQVECANRVVTQFIDQIDPDSMVVLVGDHGPESFGQLKIDGSEWSDIEVYERAGALAAIRAPAGCEIDLPDDHHLVNTFRIALSCLTPSPIPLLPHLGAP
jgi:hypothetical protein